MNNGEGNRYAIIVERKDTSDRTVKQSRNRTTKVVKEDQEINSKQGQDSQETAITVENQDISKANAE